MIRLKTILKEFYPSDPIRQLAGVLVKYESEILLLKRTDNGLWAMPGGHVDKNEKPIDGAIRELSEETGIPASKSDLKLVSKVLNKKYSIYSSYLYETNIKLVPERLNNEHSEWGYFSVDNLPQPMMPEAEKEVRRVLE